MEKINARTAKNEFAEHAGRVRWGGEHFTVTSSGKTTMVWVPEDWYERATAALEREEQQDQDGRHVA